MLSLPGALPDFNFLMAASSSSTVKSDNMLASAVPAQESEVTLSTRHLQCEVPVCIWEASSIIQKFLSYSVYCHLSFTQVRYADKRIVNITKVYIERNNCN